jgi:hypothetical protein
VIAAPANRVELPEGGIMKEQAKNLVKATQALVAYIQENHVFDKLADGGCGLYDTYRSDPFDEALNNARSAVHEMEKALAEAD